MKYSVVTDSPLGPRPGIFGDLCVARVPPGVRRSGQAVAEIVDLLGIDQGLTGHQRNDTALLVAIASWLVARRITRLVLLVNECPTRVLDTLNRTLLGAGVDLHVVYRSGTNTLHRRFLKRNDAYESSISEMNLEPPITSLGNSGALPFPTVPRSSFLWFRSTARATMSAAAFRQMDDQLQNSAQRATVVVQAIQDASDSRVLDLLRDEAELATSIDELVTRCAGVQIAFLKHGYLLKVDIPRLALSSTGASTDWSLACRYIEPWRAAVVVLIHMGLGIDEIRGLDIAGISADGKTVSLDESNSIRVPTGGDVALLALRAHASFRATTTPLSDLADRTIERAALAAARELGLPLRAGPERNGASKNWRHKSGVSCRRVVFE